ncbi:MAG: hypothetical protein MZU91_11310 [Desulfosudis oleivorans]|nr:hypothetical protein [Desulfosudis oleivorans]
MVAEIFGTSLKHSADRRPALQELVLVGPRPHRRRPGPDLRGRAPGTCWPRSSRARSSSWRTCARAALFVELVVSWTVWSHHLMSDQAQPGILKIVSGEMVTAFELITQGLAFFITLATLWSARPLKMTNAAQVPARRPARVRAGGAGRHHAGRPRPEPHPPQHAVDRRAARPRGGAGRPDHDALLGDLPAVPDPDQRGEALQREAGHLPLLGAPARRHRHGRVHGHGRPAGHAAAHALRRTASSTST